MIITSIASWEPCCKGRLFATTSMSNASATGTSRFMSASRTLRATWHQPRGKHALQRAQGAGPGLVVPGRGAGCAVVTSGSSRWRRRHSRTTRNRALGTVTSSRGGMTLKTRATKGPALDSSSARDEGVRSEKRISYARAFRKAGQRAAASL